MLDFVKAKALLFAFLFVLALPAWQVMAGGARVTVRSGHAGINRSSGGFVHHRHFHSGFRHHGHHGLNVTIGRLPHHHGLRHNHRFRHHGHFHHGFGHQVFVAPHPHFHSVVPHYGFHSVVITSPFFCIDHGLGLINQAGFLDHLYSYHGISLESGLSFCTEAGSSCIFGF